MRVEGGRRLLFVLLILTNLLISAIIVANQSQVYTSVKKAIEYLQTTSGVVAYSDETGNTSWYMRDRGYYLNPEISYEDFDKQYSDLKDSGADYLLWTDEFNRGSRYLDPKTDPRYQLVYIYSQPIRDPLDIIADKVGLFDDTEFTTFTTKVYKVN